MSTYGAAAAQSQKLSAPCSCSRVAISAVRATIPVTLEAAENEPISSGRSACSSSRSRRSSRSTPPSLSSLMVTTSAIDSRQGISLEWCSNGPMNTTGRWSAGMCRVRWWVSSRADGMRRPRIPISLVIAPVQPEPAKTTTVWSSPPTASWMIPRACSRSRVVWRPVPLDSVWVLA